MARLIDELRKLPGVGTKSAQRYAFHILRSSDADANALAAAIRALKQHLRLCSICNNITDVDPCGYCTNPARNQHIICVVEEPTNIAAIEKTRSYNGVYHVLHGTLSPVNGVGPEQLRLANLWPRARPTSDAETSSGEARSHPRHLPHRRRRSHRRLPRRRSSAVVSPHLRVTRIATGVPAGSDIEYADEVTMTRALEGRRDL